MFLLVFCADKWAIILTALPVSEQLKILRWQCPMLPIRGESDSWCASHLSTLPPRPTFPPALPQPSLRDPPPFPPSFTLLRYIRSLLLLPSAGEGGLSPLQITDTKRRWWRRRCWELPVQGPVSINETMKVYFARMHVLNSFLCDSWLGNVSVNLIKDSAGSHYFLSTPVPDGVKVHHLHPWLVWVHHRLPPLPFFPSSPPFFFLKKKLFVCWEESSFFFFFTNTPPKDTRSSMFRNDSDAKVYSKATHISTKQI